jgi:hypothetical protein
MGEATAFAGMGGPPGFIVRSDGSIQFTAKVTHVGRWRVAVRLWSNGQWGRRGGFELVVEPLASAPVVASQATPAVPTPTPEAINARRAQERADANALVGCELGFGIAAGATDVRDNWVFINQDYHASASPMVSFSCRNGRAGGFMWFAGLDSAPAFVFYNDDERFRHSLVSTVGVGWTSSSFRAGPFASLGFTLLGLGARVGVYPIKMKNGYRHGFELRGMVFPQKQLAGQISLLYSIDLGNLWP